MNQTISQVQTIANLTINRENRTLWVNDQKVPVLDREFELVDQLARSEGPIGATRLGRQAFKTSELTTPEAVLQILDWTRRKLTVAGARRGLLHKSNHGRLTMFKSPETVDIQVFHVPVAHFTAGPDDGSLTPDKTLCELVWTGNLPETDDRTVLEQVFHSLNLDTRPNGKFAPAMSSGDLVTLQAGTPEEITYQCSNEGWIHLKGVIRATPEELLDTLTRLLPDPAGH